MGVRGEINLVSVSRERIKSQQQQAHSVNILHLSWLHCFKKIGGSYKKKREDETLLFIPRGEKVQKKRVTMTLYKKNENEGKSTMSQLVSYRVTLF